MTNNQCQQFNAMRATLKRIATGYQSPEQIRRNAERDYGLDAIDAFEMAYENIQQEARSAVKGVREISLENAKAHPPASNL